MANPKPNFPLERDELWLRILSKNEVNGHVPGLTQQRLAELLGISPPSVRRRLARARKLRLAAIDEQDRESIKLYLGPNQQGPGATPATCGHPRAIVQRGASWICLDCGASGMDHMSDMKAAALPADPKPTEVPLMPESGASKRKKAKAK